MVFHSFPEKTVENCGFPQFFLRKTVVFHSFPGNCGFLSPEGRLQTEGFLRMVHSGAAPPMRRHFFDSPPLARVKKISRETVENHSFWRKLWFSTVFLSGKLWFSTVFERKLWSELLLVLPIIRLENANLEVISTQNMVSGSKKLHRRRCN